MNADYAADNAAERRRLLALTGAWTESDLMHQMPNGWTVASTLVHMAFWDYQYVALLDEWERSGLTSPSPDVHAINEAVRILSLAIPPAATVDLVRAAAEAIDSRLEDISPELEAAIEAGGRVRLLRRSIHRRLHLDQIEKALGR